MRKRLRYWWVSRRYQVVDHFYEHEKHDAVIITKGAYKGTKMLFGVVDFQRFIATGQLNFEIDILHNPKNARLSDPKFVKLAGTILEIEIRKGIDQQMEITDE